MANLAEQLKAELTERARNSESCKKYLLDWVMNEFRSGENPVYIKCTNYILGVRNPEWIERCGETYKKHTDYMINLKYEEGKHFAKINNREWVDITDSEIAQLFACDGRDESDKTLFLRSEGFKVHKTWIYGRGDLLEITY